MQGGSGSGEGPGTTTPHSPGAGFVPPRPEDLAPHFPQLEVIELLGHGGMGVVYKARQIRLDRLVALKILPPELGRDPAFAERFAREARALARLTHPRIVGVHDFGESGGLFYLVMEFVDGVNLRGLLRRGRLEPEEALRIIPQVCEALQYAHEEGVVHRDIKPENILLDRRGNVKIADFGLAKLLGSMATDSALTGSRQVVGTLRYMAPEQMERPLAVDHRADIYSLGVVFYEMLTGELPMGRFAPPSKKAAVDVRLDEVVFRALEKEPERRYQHVSEVKTEVESLSSPSGASRELARPRPGRGREPSRRETAGGMAAGPPILRHLRSPPSLTSRVWRAGGAQWRGSSSWRPASGSGRRGDSSRTSHGGHQDYPPEIDTPTVGPDPGLRWLLTGQSFVDRERAQAMISRIGRPVDLGRSLPSWTPLCDRPTTVVGRHRHRGRHPR